MWNRIADRADAARVCERRCRASRLHILPSAVVLQLGPHAEYIDLRNGQSISASSRHCQCVFCRG